MPSQFGQWKIPPRTTIKVGGVVGLSDDWTVTNEYDDDEESEYDVLGQSENETPAEV